MKRVLSFEQSKVPFLDFEVVYDGIKIIGLSCFTKTPFPAQTAAAAALTLWDIRPIRQ